MEERRGKKRGRSSPSLQREGKGKAQAAGKEKREKKKGVKKISTSINFYPWGRGKKKEERGHLPLPHFVLFPGGGERGKEKKSKKKKDRSHFPLPSPFPTKGRGRKGKKIGPNHPHSRGKKRLKVGKKGGGWEKKKRNDLEPAVTNCPLIKRGGKKGGKKGKRKRKRNAPVNTHKLLPTP